ncbi:hypothetical protein EV363DRAFT_1318137 [Boletus edulis]|uniref:Uncharacterized protein n=1 Tax=Boletus edulis BED1 TaxID=1328754 RepID=A0AAD4BRK0_BOLED|nr:hypothetical protein EV363DRAFT_1318137 [Boletus edulis]KAF8438087.1 hypothetical protein L210DRAFT_3545414 [Boletus edulis BED1]
MFRFASLALLAAHVLAAPQVVPSSSTICRGYMWGVTIQPLYDSTVYNQYVRTTDCAGPAWVQSSMEPTPPSSIRPWGTTYDCQVPEIPDQYNCGDVQVATCCGELL